MDISARLVPEVQCFSMAAPEGAPLVRRLRIEHDDLGFLEETARLLGFRSRMLQLEAGTNPSRLELVDAGEISLLRLQFSREGYLHGAHTTNYLLERSRVVGHAGPAKQANCGRKRGWTPPARPGLQL